MKRSYLSLAVFFIAICFGACKKDSSATPVAGNAVTIVGKWYVTQHNLKLFSGGKQVGASSKSNYTANDYIQYFTDGTGIQSASSSSGAPALSTFTYKLNGLILTQVNSSNVTTIETVTMLSATAFAIHYESTILDPADQSQVDNEVDDFYFER
jgi:hypothetical protein